MSRAVPRFLAAVVILVGVLALALPVYAHEALVGTTPGDGEALTAAPTEVVLTFSNDLLESPPTVVVSTSSGDEITLADPVVEGATLTQPLPAGLLNGAYEVAWRVVSADGHPIEGAFTFAVAVPAQAGPASATVEPSPTEPEPTAEAPAEVTATPTDDATALPEDAEGSGGAGALLWGIGLLAVVLVVLTGVVLRARRR